MCPLTIFIRHAQEIAVSLLCQRTQNADRSKKRRRVEGAAPSSEDLAEVRPLQPLLQCLESALKADAHEGGNWTRGDDNQRYHAVSFRYAVLDCPKHRRAVML